MIRITDLVIILICLIIVNAFFSVNIIPKDAYGYDEADYMFAVSKGFFANYTDQNTISFNTFIKLGIEQGFNKSERTSLSEFIRKSEDINFYRHYHGPLYYYGLMLLKTLFGDNEDQIRKWAFIILLSAMVIAVYFSCIYLKESGSHTSSVIAATMLLFSPVIILTAAKITPHSIYVLISIIALFYMAKLLKTKDLKYSYYSIVAIAFSFIAIEYAILLLLTFIICVSIYRKGLFELRSSQIYIKYILAWVLIFVVIILIVWPSGLLKLSLVKNYIFFAYFALVRGGEYGSNTFLQVWLGRILNSPVEFAIIFIILPFVFLKLKTKPIYLPYLLYASLMFLTSIRNTSTASTYVSSLFPPLYILSGLIIVDRLKIFSKSIRIGVITIIICSLSLVIYFQFIPQLSSRMAKTPLKEVVFFVKENNYNGNRILIDRMLSPTFHYYFPDRQFSSFSQKEKSVREVSHQLSLSEFEGVITSGKSRSIFEKELERYFLIDSEFITRDSSFVYIRLQRE